MIPLTPIDLSAATVNGTGLIDFSKALPSASPRLGADPSKWATLQVFNESGCGLQVMFPGTGHGAYVPAGRWGDLPIPPGVDTADYTVLYIVSGGQVNSLLCTYYAPGEPVPSAGALGNSPTGISGAVTTSGSSGTAFIKNDGNAPATSIIESTPSDQSSSATSINNDGSGFWRVLSANVLRTVVNVVRGNNTSGKATVTIGDSGDTSVTTFYGTVGAGSVVPASVVGSGYPAGDISGSVASAVALVNGGPAALSANNDGSVNLPNGGSIAANADVHANSFSPASGGGLLTGCHAFSGNGSGTYSHGLTATPGAVLVNTANGTNSTTYGSGSYTASSVFIYQFNGQPFVALAMRT